MQRKKCVYLIQPAEDSSVWRGFTYISRKYVTNLVVSQFGYFFVCVCVCVRACGIDSNKMIGPFDPQQQQFNLT